MKLIVFITFYLLVASNASAEILPSRNLNLSQRYEQLIHSSSPIWSARDTEELKQYRVIFVPGIFSNVILGLGSYTWARHTSLGRYFDDHSEWLESVGVETTKVRYRYEGSPGDNAWAVVEAIEESTKPVIIVAHSKGGLDVIRAFMSLERGGMEKVRGMIAIQVPFYGSPIAQLITEIRSLRYFARWALPYLNTSYSALESLNLRSRNRYSPSPELKEEIQFLEGLSQQLPVLAFASYKRGGIDRSNPWQYWTGQDTLLYHSRNLIERRFGMRNDGMVPVMSALLPGSNYVVASNVDHVVAVARSEVLRFDRVQYSQTLFRLLLSKPIGKIKSGE